jgi:hypothetical protein
MAIAVGLSCMKELWYPFRRDGLDARKHWLIIAAGGAADQIGPTKSSLQLARAGWARCTAPGARPRSFLELARKPAF